MKHAWIIAASALLSASGAMAADTPAATDKPAAAASGEEHQRWTPPKTRQEAIERTQKRLDKLKSMSDADWQKQQDMYRERAKARWQHRHGGQNSNDATPPATDKQ